MSNNREDRINAEYVTLLRDGYHYVKTVKGEDD